MLYFRTHAEEGAALEVNLAVLADYANVSQDGKLNIMGIFQEVNPPMMPFVLPQLFLVVSFEADAAEFETLKSIKIAMLDDDGNEMLGLEGQAQVPRPPRPGSQAYINQVLGLNGIRFERPGDYSFAILVGGETRGSVPLRVNELTEEVPDDGNSTNLSPSGDEQ